MATWFWINVPLMVLAFALTTGLSYALLLGDRRKAGTATRIAAAAELAPALAPTAGSVRTARAYPAAA